MKIRLLFLLVMVAFAAMKNFAQEQNVVLKTATGDIRHERGFKRDFTSLRRDY